MKWSETFIPTMREDPGEAEIASHKLMMRAGLMRKLSSGLYTFLPFGLRVLRKVEQIVREEMNRAGALEILMPALQPREIWDTSGRYKVMGPALYKLKDRQDRDMVLGPTHEEVVTDLAFHELRSYRQMPKTFYQIQTKFRDEIRPRFGLMRAKEFIMKDAYSFDIDWAGADKSYQAMYDAYVRIFKRCGLRFKVVEADTGAIGGKWSHEFMVLADSGEDGLAECDICSYAANLERAERSIHENKQHGNSKDMPSNVPTPGMRTIDEVAGYLKVEPDKIIKTLIYVIKGQPCALLIPGNRDLNEHKVARLMESSEVAMADNNTIEMATGGPVGFCGPMGLKIPIYADMSLRGSSGMVTGANKADTHTVNVSLDRDAKVTAYMDLCIVRAGDNCPKCTGKLVEKRGIEVGHVFKLGTKYSDAFDAQFLDDSGNKAPIIMGCYGIGISRTAQAVIEQCHDDNGIIWPASIAPYTVGILVLDTNIPRNMETAKQLHDELQKLGYDVLIDDRDERPGVKFKDADLIGFPVRIVVSERSLTAGGVEIKTRTQTTKGETIPLAAAVSKIREIVDGSLKSE